MNIRQRLLGEASGSHSLDRRQFIKRVGGGGGAFVLGCAVAPSIIAGTNPLVNSDDSALVFNAFLKITPENQVIVVIKHLDKGQGVTTGLATIVAEELDADWSQVGWEFAPADGAKYNNIFWGNSQGTGGSTSIANSWQQLRNAGASARQMMVNAAAKKWGVNSSSIQVSNGVVSAGENRATFGDLVALAAQQSVPAAPTLKSTKAFNLIGKHVSRKDSYIKTTGKAIFTQDIQLDGLLTALVKYPPKMGGRVKKFDASKAKAIEGVIDVVQIPRGIAVVATGFWAAKKARDILTVDWDLSACETRSSEELYTSMEIQAATKGHVIGERGDANAAIVALGKGEKIVEASYRVPFLAHATMEPMNCVVRVGDTSCELWFGSQMPTTDQQQVAAYLGLPPEKVTINTLFAGGSFGRRASPGDYVIDAAAIAQAFKGKPVKMVWTREDDMNAGKFRPGAVHKLKAKVSREGVLAWQQHSVAPSIFRGTDFEFFIKGAVDPTVTEGIADMPYKMPHFLLHGSEFTTPLTHLWWRSVGHSGNAFIVESFIDQLARAAEQDPLNFRRSLLQNEPRWLGVLNLAAEKSGWGKPMPVGRAQGIAVHKAMGSWVAQVAEVELDAERNVVVKKVYCAVDCGIAVNPDVIRAQMEGSIGFALGQVLGEQITFKDGYVEQQNFNRYKPIRISQMPDVEVHIVASQEPPTGVGEPGVPPLAPAVANAVFAITGKPVTTLPINV